VTNLVISTVCNRHCAYCFALDHLAAQGEGGGAGGDGRFLPLEGLQARLDFLDRSDMDVVRLLGGEPTLHPRFVEVVARARATGKAVTVFSNGLMPPQALSCLASLPAGACSVLVNVNEPDGERNGSRGGNGRGYERQREALRRLGERGWIGFNIHRTDFQPGFLLDLVAETGCRPAIRLSMAQPSLSGTNRYIHPNQYRAVAVKIVAFARAAAGAGVRLEFDCGFVRCMFSDDDLAILKSAEANMGWRCNPILDVDIEGRVLHCYPLARLGTLPLTAEATAPALRAAFEARTQPYRQAGVFGECSRCPFKAEGSCTGGCLAATIRRFRHTPFRLEMPAVEEGPG
jgi:MoaA/NifB/PqqE/SkfB family radical SAM enzyme